MEKLMPYKETTKMSSNMKNITATLLTAFAVLSLQAAIAFGAEPKAPEPKAEAAQGKARFKTPAEYEAALKANNLTEKDLLEIVRKDIVINNLLEKEVTSKITVPETDIKKFYDENQDKFKKPEGYRASHILIGVDPKATPEEKRRPRKKPRP